MGNKNLCKDEMNFLFSFIASFQDGGSFHEYAAILSKPVRFDCLRKSPFVHIFIYKEDCPYIIDSSFDFLSATLKNNFSIILPTERLLFVFGCSYENALQNLSNACKDNEILDRLHDSDKDVLSKIKEQADYLLKFMKID